MLVLSRKQTQELRVGDDITITVLEVKGHVVRLGIQACLLYTSDAADE